MSKKDDKIEELLIADLKAANARLADDLDRTLRALHTAESILATQLEFFERIGLCRKPEPREGDEQSNRIFEMMLEAGLDE